MFKHLYKTLLIAVISGSLLSLQTSVAFAEAKNNDTTTSTDKNGIITSVKKLNLERFSDTDLLTSITMIAGGFITGRMLVSYRPVTMDVTIAGAAGAAFIAAELASNMKFKGTIDKMILEVEKKNNGEVNEEQIQRIKDLRQSYVEAKGATQTKKSLQLAAATAFGLAAAASAYLTYTEEAEVKACRVVMQQAKAKLSSCAATGATGNAEAGSCSSCLGVISNYEGMFSRFNMYRRAPGLSAMKDKQTTLDKKLLTDEKQYCSMLTGGPVVGSVHTEMATCNKAAMTEVHNQTRAKNPITSTTSIKNYFNLPIVTENQNSNNYINKIIDFIFPSAQASWVPMFGFGLSTLAALTAASATIGANLDVLMFVPSNRAIAFAMFGGLSLLASKSSQNVMEKLDRNIEKLDVILEDLNKLSGGVKTQNINLQQIKLPAIPKSGNIAVFSNNGTVKTPCMTSNTNSNCPPLINQLSSMPGFSGLPDSFKDLASQSVKLGDSLSGATGISGSTLAAADNLGGKQAAVAKLLNDKMTNLNKISGDKIPFEKAQDNLLADMNSKVKGSLQKNGMTASGFMASFGGTSIDTSLKKEETTTTIAKSAPFNAPTVNIGSTSSTESTKHEEKFSLDFKDTSNPTQIAANEPAAAQAAPEYEMKEAEINNENGPSIFELISGRYLKSGYPKLLEEEPSKN